MSGVLQGFKKIDFIFQKKRRRGKSNNPKQYNDVFNTFSMNFYWIYYMWTCERINCWRYIQYTIPIYSWIQSLCCVGNDHEVKLVAFKDLLKEVHYGVFLSCVKWENLEKEWFNQGKIGKLKWRIAQHCTNKIEGLSFHFEKRLKKKLHNMEN